MIDLMKKIDKKINNIIFTLIGNGFLLLILGILIVWTDFVLRLTVGIMVLVVAYIFFYASYKAWSIKDEVKKYLKL